MIKHYIVHVPSIVKSDITRAVNRKREFDAYESTILEFKEEIDKKVKLLETSPLSGANLSARVHRLIKAKYFVIEDYLLFFEVKENHVHVMRFLSAKSNWMNKIIG